MLRKMPTIIRRFRPYSSPGYPNVGKSSFIVRITGARPEIAAILSHTRNLCGPLFNRGDQKYQVVEHARLLDRPMYERNRLSGRRWRH